MLTPSALARFEICTASELLPHAQIITLWGRRGSVVHGFLQAVSNLGRAEAIRGMKAEFRTACAAIPLERLPPLDPTKCAVEVAFALNWKTGEGREIGRGITREEAAAKCGPDEMPGIADYVALTPDEVVIVDWKTGYGHVDAAEVNLQTGSYALAAAKAYRRDRARVLIIRVLDNGDVYVDVAVHDVIDLAATEARVRMLHERLAEARGRALPQPVLGDHCRYCPALRFCPAQFQALVEILANEPPPDAAIVPALTPEAAGKAWVKLKIAKKLVEQLEDTVEKLARQAPVPLPNGKFLAQVEETRESIDPERAAPVLRALHGSDFVAAVTQTKTSITKERLHDGLRDHVHAFLEPDEKGRQPALAPLERKAYDALRKQGATNVASYIVVDEVKPERLQLGEGATASGKAV